MQLYLHAYLCLIRKKKIRTHTSQNNYVLFMHTHLVFFYFYLTCFFTEHLQTDTMEVCSSASLLGQQLTLVELERLSFIGPEEFVQAFAKDSPHIDSSFKDMKKTKNLESYVHWFNRLSYLVASEICKVRFTLYTHLNAVRNPSVALMRSFAHLRLQPFWLHLRSFVFRIACFWFWHIYGQHI